MPRRTSIFQVLFSFSILDQLQYLQIVTTVAKKFSHQRNGDHTTFNSQRKVTSHVTLTLQSKYQKQLALETRNSRVPFA